MNKYKPEVTRTQKIHEKNTDSVAFIQAVETSKQADRPDDNKDSSGGTGDTKTYSKGEKLVSIAVGKTTGDMNT